MPAKFVNLVEFFECQAAAKVKMVNFVEGGINGNGIVTRLDAINIRPEIEFAFRQGRHRNARMVNGHIFPAQVIFHKNCVEN